MTDQEKDKRTRSNDLQVSQGHEAQQQQAQTQSDGKFKKVQTNKQCTPVRNDLFGKKRFKS